MLQAALNRPFLTVLLAFAVAAAGSWAWRGIPVDAIPDLSDNQVIVWAEWPGQSPEEVDQQVTVRLARELQALPGVRTVRGLSLSGAAYVYVIFEDGRDLYASRTRVLERLGQLGRLLPPGVVPRLGPDATAMGQVYGFVLRGRGDVEQKRFVLDQVVVPALQAVPGVSEVAPVGGVRREYQIDIEPLRLAELGLSLSDVTAAVAQAGRDVGLMSVEHSGVDTMLRARGFVRSVAEVEALVVRGDPARGVGLRLGDVATVQLGGQVRQGLLSDAEQEHVGALVALRIGADPRAVIDGVKAALRELGPTLTAEGLYPDAFYDRTELIEETVATLSSTLFEAVVTTVFVVVAFLLHVRGSLAVAVSLPLGMLFTFLVMRWLGLSANVMSLAGIGIAIGVMVDFGIIMTENITQHLVDLQERCRREGRAVPVSPFAPEIGQAVAQGAREVARPLITSAATTIIGFLPIFALQDQAGRLFEPMAVTKSLAITGAAAFGILLVPVLCRFLLPPWQVRRGWLLVFTGLASGAAFGWWFRSGLSWPQDYGRWEVVVPGWLAGPALAALVGLIVWRLGRERLVTYEENPTSRLIHWAYEAAYVRILRHRVAFTSAIVGLALLGYLLGAGWSVVSWPLRETVAAAGGDLNRTRLDQAMSRWFPGVGSSFLPPLDEGALLFMPSIPAAGGIGEAQRIMVQQNALIESVPEVGQVMGKLGRAETALDPAPIGMIETVVLLKPYKDWPAHEFAQEGGSVVRRPRTLAEVREALAAISHIPGVAPSWLQPIETRVVMLSTGIRSLLALQLAGHDSPAMEMFAEAAEKIIQTTPGAVDVQVQREGGKPYAEVRLDAARLARFGLTKEAVMQALESAVGGMAMSYSVEGALQYPLRVRYARERRDDPDELVQVRIPLPDGSGSVPLLSVLAVPTVFELRFPRAADRDDLLRRLALADQRNFVALGARAAELTVAAGESWPPALAAAVEAGTVVVQSTRANELGLTYTVGPMAIRSEGGQRIQHILLNARGRGEVDVVRDADARLRQALAAGELTLPPGTTYRWVGRYEQKLKADQTLRWVIGASFLIMVGLIYTGTRSWLITSVIVLCNAVVTTAGGFFFVWWWGAEMTTAVAVGFLVLLGVMFNDGILLGTYIQEQFRTPPDTVAEVHRRVFLAGLRRRRPAIMTNATTLLSLVPVLWATGRGAELMQPMVLPVAGGMIFDLVSLFSVPVYFTWYWERRLRRRAGRAAAAGATAR